MFAQTFSSEEADLSLLPDPDVFEQGDGDPVPDASGPFGAAAPQDAPWDLSGSAADDPGHHPDDGHDAYDVHDGWDPLFGGDA